VEYAEALAERVPDSVTWLLAKLSSAARDDWCLQISIERRWRLASLLGALWVHGLQGKPLKKASRRSVEAEHQFVVAGAEILRVGRAGFYELLDRIRARPATGIESQLFREAFPGLLRRLRKHLVAGELMTISEFIRDYLDTQTGPVLIVTRNKELGSTESIATCARRLDIRPDRVANLLRDQGAAYAVRIAPSGRKMAAIRKADLRALEGAKSNSLSRRDVQRLYGLSSSRQAELVKACWIRVIGRRIDRVSIEALVGRLVAHSGKLTTKDLDDFVSLSEILRTVVPVSQTIAFITGVTSGAIGVVCNDKRVRDYREILVSKSDTRRALEQNRQTAPGLTIPAAAKHLGLKQEVMYHLVRQGLVATTRRVIGRRAGACISTVELDRLTREIQPLANVATAAGIDKRWALRWAQERGLMLVSGPQIDGGRQYFVKCNEPVELR
jgi:hypothetical protein